MSLREAQGHEVALRGATASGGPIVSHCRAPGPSPRTRSSRGTITTRLVLLGSQRQLSSCVPSSSRHFITLSDMPQAVIGIECALCQRREQFDVEALKVQHGGDVKMPELLSRLVADCPRQQQQQKSFSVYDRCRAGYDKGSRYGA